MRGRILSWELQEKIRKLCAEAAESKYKAAPELRHTCWDIAVKRVLGAVQAEQSPFCS